MGDPVLIPGLGVVSPKGDDFTQEELDAIFEALQEAEKPMEFQPIPKPIAPPGVGLPEQSGEAMPVGEGPLGVVPTGARRPVRRFVERQPSLIQFAAEAGPSIATTIEGARRGAALGTMVKPGVGTAVGAVAGGMIGGGVGETLAQEVGLAPKSNLNIGLATAGPLLGPVTGGTFKGARRLAGTMITRGLPAARVARARNLMGQAVSEFESIGSSILSKTGGMLARSAYDLYGAARRAGVRIAPNLMSNTSKEIDEVIKELTPLQSFTDVASSIKSLQAVKDTILNNPKGATLEQFITARSQIGAIIGRSRQGGIKVNKAKNLFRAMTDDLNQIAESPFRKGRQARLAKAAVARAKLEFATQRLQDAVFQNMRQDPRLRGGIFVNFAGIKQWVDDVTNPKFKRKFDKNFTEAMKEFLPDLKARLNELAKISKEVGSPAGAGSIVMRGQSARIGRGLGGAALGFLGTGGTATGAAIGGLVFAQAPEMLVGLLTTPGGAAFLESAARWGKGNISMKAWQVGSQLLMRSLGETGSMRVPPTIEAMESAQQPPAGAPRQTSQAPGDQAAVPGTLEFSMAQATPRERKRLPKDFK